MRMSTMSRHYIMCAGMDIYIIYTPKKNWPLKNVIKIFRKFYEEVEV